MRVLKRNRWLSGLAVLLAVLVVYGGRALADVTTDDPGSLVIFPKVIANGTRDTLIQITNTSNMPVQAHCIYVNGSGFCELTQSQACVRANTSKGSLDCPLLPNPNPTNARENCIESCTERNFDIFLTAQQPTVWRVSTGRNVDSMDSFKGFDPGKVLPVVPDFQGDLRCIQTETTGPGSEVPFDGNALKGEAVLETIATGEISEYNGIAIKAKTDGSLNGDNVLEIGTEYNACPATLWLNHYADGFADQLFPTATVTTELTLVPCSEDLEHGLVTPSRAQFDVVNEEESHIGSAFANFNCFFNSQLSDIDLSFTSGTSGNEFLKTKITPSSGKVCYSGDNAGLSCVDNSGCPNALGLCNGDRDVLCHQDSDCTGQGTTAPCDLSALGCRQRPGLLGVAEEFHTTTPGQAGTAATNLHIGGSRPGDIYIPPATSTP